MLYLEDVITKNLLFELGANIQAKLNISERIKSINLLQCSVGDKALLAILIEDAKVVRLVEFLN